MISKAFRSTRAGIVGRCTVTAALGVALSGCVSLTVTGSDGTIQVTRHVGLLHITVVEPARAVVGTILGVGVIGSPLGWSIGYTRQRWSLLGDDCRVVAWLPAGDAARRWARELKEAAAVCLIQDTPPLVAPSSPEPS